MYILKLNSEKALCAAFQCMISSNVTLLIKIS